MTDLTSFHKTDLVDDHVAADVNKLIDASWRPEYANTETISATKTLTDNDCQFQFLTASGANRTVKLAPESTANHITVIYNSGASNNLVVQEDSGTNTLETIAPGEFAICYPLNTPSWWVQVYQATRDYKLSPTVASNNLTLALKHLDGNDPSATRPIMFVINGSRRYVVATLSVTVNAGAASGAGTFNAGAAELATKAIDYFAYAGWRAASSAVVLGYGRIPWATVYSDFSGTAANEKYGAFSTTPASTDDVINIGRFEATNSGSASYNWSVPSYTSTNLKHVPTYETRRLDWTPTHDRTTTGYTNVPTVGNAHYQVFGTRLLFYERHTQNATPGGSGNQRFTLPFTNPFAGGQLCMASNNTAATNFAAYFVASVNQVQLIKYDGTAEATASQTYSAEAVVFLN